MPRSIVVLTAMLGLLAARPAVADEVHFLNGDRLTGKVLTLYHTLEYLPRFDDPESYLLNIDAGVRTMIWKGFFSEFKVEFHHNSEPAPNRETTDVRYIAGVGWQF